ncbi:carboxypeptidase regulatory-like domain-containing protein [Candidatus Micrarchaeota archaeon]|nr:carboxypeptidase regulatory-like domain-containing protein [Candidatus Micrarchaeota archaeon]
MGFLDGLKAAYFSIEDHYYDFAEGLQRKGIPFLDFFVKPIEGAGIPSMPVFLLLIVAISAGALLVLTQTTGVKTVTIQVDADGQPLDGARIQLLLDGEVIAEKRAQNGAAVFSDVPQREYTVRILQEGFDPARRTLLADQTSLRVDLKSGSDGSSIGFLDRSRLRVIVQDEQTKQPISAASIAFNSAKQNGQETTNAQGEAILPQAAVMNLRISKTGYKPDVRTVRGGGDVTVYLKATNQALFTQPGSGGGENQGGGTGTLTPPGTSFSDQGIVTVTITNGSDPVNGNVKLYNAQAVLLGEGTTVEGVIVFTAPIGDSVYPTINAEGFALFDGSARAKVVEEFTEFQIALAGADAPVGEKTTIKAVDKDENALYFSAKVFKPPAIELAAFDGEQWELLVSPGTYYVWIQSPGFLAKTFDLVAGQNHVIQLEKATPFNAATLTVRVQDEYGESLSGANVRLEKENRVFSADVETDSQGEARFDEIPVGTVGVFAQFGTKTVRGTTNVEQGGSTATITLTIHRATLNVKTSNAVDSQAVPAAMELSNLIESTQTCQGAACSFTTAALVENRLRVTADGFRVFAASLVMADDEQRNLSAVMVPSQASGGAKIEFIQIKDVSGQPVQSLQPGREYVVEFNATPAAQAEAQGIYLRVGSKSSVDGDDVAIIEHSTADAAQKSTEYNPSTSCADLQPEFTSGLQGYKWVALDYDEPAVRLVSFVVRVREGASTNQALSLYYATHTNAGSVYARDPLDPAGQTCYPKTYEIKLPLVAGSIGGGNGGGNGGTGTPTPTPPPGTPNPLPSGHQYTPKVGISFNPATGQIEVDAPEIVLEVDAIYPKDAVPLNFNDASCTIGFKIQSSQSSCYQVSRESLTFSTKDFSASCPSFVEGNQVKLQQDPQAKLVLQALCSGVQAQKEVPIRIHVAQVNSLTAAPQKLDEGEGTAKLLYVVNQKQQGLRTLTPLGASGTITLSDHAATALSWKGPGTLTLLEGETVVGEWTYENGPAYFEGIGTLGSRVSSASDYMSCAQGWCTGTAAIQAISAFKQEAQKTAQATVFRRGSNAMPTTTPNPTPTASPTASASPSPGASTTPSASPSPTASASPNPTASPSADAMHINDEKTAANGFKIQLTAIETVSGRTKAFFDVKNAQGAVVDAVEAFAGEQKTTSGLVINVQSVHHEATTANRYAEVTLTVSSAQTAPASQLNFAEERRIAADPFTFSTVMQLTEDADKALEAAGFEVKRSTGCRAGDPAVFLVQATTSDGQNFQYTASTLELHDNLDQPQNQIPLCGFLHAQGPVIVATTNPVLPSQNQANDQHTQPQIQFALFIQAPIFKAQCESLGKKVIDLDTQIKQKKTVEIPKLEATQTTACGSDPTAAACTNAKKATEKARADLKNLESQLKATKQKCNAMQYPLFEIPPGLRPQFSQFTCYSDYDKISKQIQEAQKEADALKEKLPQTTGAQDSSPIGDLNDQWTEANDKLDELKGELKGCKAFCQQKPACIEMFPNGRQFTKIIHLGLSPDCSPFSKNAAIELGNSFLISTLMKDLGPYAALSGIGCGFAQGYYNQQQLGGPQGFADTPQIQPQQVQA